MSEEQPRKILVVDDEPEVRKLVTAMLARNGYRVLSADSGENALRLFKNNTDTDLLLTDVVAPGMSGPMIADQVAALKPDIRVLFMSGYDSTQVVQRYVVEKGYSLLVKPFTMEQLENTVRSVLEGSGKRAGA
ncbi:MAG TPA: response regulator [Bryobacteraceae bacterium]|jgi:two-component system cell cycle sensor histidine kinase/response regulator CckA|nr:response regulator [Bryobacteraceae bacterium]